MRLTNEVVVAAPSEAVFRLLAEMERVASCLPGATLAGRAGTGSYRGRLEIAVGPVTAAYQGTVRMMEVDEEGRRMVLDARGADQHASGSAAARVEVRVGPHPRGSAMALDTDLVIRGRVAQFGRGAVADVSQKLMEQFAGNIEALLADGAAAAPPSPVAAVPVRQRAAAVVGVIVVVVAVLVGRRHRRGRSGSAVWPTSAGVESVRPR